MDDDETAAQTIGKGVDQVVDGGHRAVVVLIHAAGHEAIGGIEHDHGEPSRLEGFEVGAHGEDVDQPAAQALDADHLANLVASDPESRGHLRDAIRNRFAMQLVVENQHAAGDGLERIQPGAAGGHSHRQ